MNIDILSVDKERIPFTTVELTGEAAEEVIQNKIPNLGGDGGIVAIDNNGNITMEFNTAGMYRAAMNSKGEVTIGLYKEDE